MTTPLTDLIAGTVAATLRMPVTDETPTGVRHGDVDLVFVGQMGRDTTPRNMFGVRWHDDTISIHIVR